MTTFLQVGVLLFCGAWLLIYSYLMYTIKHLSLFHQFAIQAPDRWPRLSVIVPACNEAQHLEAAVNTLLKQDYPNLEVILVNDRSTDGTGTIIDRLANSDPRIKPIHISSLPRGWLGKVHALHQGKQLATGDWLLFTDADVYFEGSLLKRAVSFSLNEHIDHLTLMPNVNMNRFWLAVAINTFGLFFLLVTRAAQINRPNSKAFIGIGAFNMVNREVFDRTPGFEWLRLEVADDVGVGYMIKKAGGKSFFALADRELSLSWYVSIGPMFNGLEKNLFGAGAGYCLRKSITQVVLIWLLLAAPFAALCSSNSLLIYAGLTYLAVHTLFSIICAHNHKGGTIHLFMFPIGTLILSLMMLWSAFQCIKNGGVNWRGTFYSLDILRTGHRVEF